MNKLGYIDALRGIAILAVLTVHCIAYGTNNYPGIMQAIVGNGGRGVQLFYIVSAFTLFLSMNNRAKQERNIYSNFFIRRFFRIAPMFYIAIVYNVCERLFIGNLCSDYVPDVTTWSVISSFFFVHGLSPYWINTVVPGGWSITAEMMFYCMVPFLFIKVKNLNHAAIIFFIAIFIQHTMAFVVKQIPFSDTILMRDYLFYYLPNHLPVFACGIFLFYLVYTPKKDWNVHPAVILFLSFTILFQIATGQWIFSQHIIFAIAFVFLGYALSKREYSILVNPFTKFVGKISYSMYLVHFAVLHWMFKLDFLDFVPLDSTFGNILNLAIRYTILLAASAAISYVTYKLVERPFQKLGKFIINKREVKDYPPKVV